MYKKYPKMIETMKNRYKVYNKSLDEIKFLESEGDIFVVRPSELIKIKKMEKNEDKLKNMYNLGYNDLNSRKSELKSYLNK
jgi:predicted patatin/cPLA2 family phospholipase